MRRPHTKIVFTTSKRSFWENPISENLEVLAIDYSEIFVIVLGNGFSFLHFQIPETVNSLFLFFLCIFLVWLYVGSNRSCRSIQSDMRTLGEPEPQHPE
jgi:hypothetical protein